MKPGIKCVCYRNTGSYGTPVWTEVKGFGAFKINCDWNTVKSSVRGNRVQLGVKTDLNLEVTAEIQASDTDTDYLAVWAAVFSDEPIDFLVLNADKTTVGARGFRFDGLVCSHNEDQGTQATLMPEVKIVPTTATTDPLAVPSYAVVGTGPTLAYTPIA